MKKVYYYKCVSGRTTFVTFEKSKGYYWSKQASPVKMDSISDLKTFDTLKGKEVELNGLIGVITDCCPHDVPLNGKYTGDGKYRPHPELLRMNQLVMVHWKNGIGNTWERFDKLKLI